MGTGPKRQQRGKRFFCLDTQKKSIVIELLYAKTGVRNIYMLKSYAWTQVRKVPGGGLILKKLIPKEMVRRRAAVFRCWGEPLPNGRTNRIHPFLRSSFPFLPPSLPFLPPHSLPSIHPPSLPSISKITPKTTCTTTFVLPDVKCQSSYVPIL